MGVTKKNLSLRINKKLKLRDEELVSAVIDSFIDEIVLTMEAGEEVQINSFGRFFAKLRMKNKNPRTGEELGPMFSAKFIPSASVRARIKAKRTDFFKNEEYLENLVDE